MAYLHRFHALQTAVYFCLSLLVCPKDTVLKSYTKYCEGSNASKPRHSQFSSVQSLSHVRLFATPWTTAYQASLSIINSRSLFKLMSIESAMPSSHLILCHPLLLLPSIFPSVKVFSKESVLHIRWPKYWSFSFSIGPSIEYSGLISFRMDWLDSPCCPRDSQKTSPEPQFKNSQTGFPIGYSILHSHQQCMTVLNCLHPW